MRILPLLFLGLFFSAPAFAQVENTDGYMPNQVSEEYFSESRTNYDKSIIYVFFNNEPCYTCAQAISLIEEVYNQDFIDEYNMFLINYQNDQENNFIELYNLNQPLEVVLVQVNDGAPFGYRKLDNLQNMVSDPVSFAEYFSQEVTNFLGNQ